MYSLQEHTRRLSLQSMVLTLALRRKIVSNEVIEGLMAEAERYFKENPDSVAAAWRAFRDGEAARETETRRDQANAASVASRDERFSLKEVLAGRKILSVIEESGSITLPLDDGSTLTISFRSGPGADSNWYNWVEILCNGIKVRELEL